MPEPLSPPPPLPLCLSSLCPVEDMQLRIKPKGVEAARAWQEYVDDRPKLLQRILRRAPKWKTHVGQSLDEIYRVCSQRVHGERAGDLIEIPRAWFTDEQVWVVGSVLTEARY